MINKIVSIEEAVSHVHDGDTVMIGGFGHYGAPTNIFAAIAEKGIQGLTTISECVSPTYRPHINNIRPMLEKKCIKHIICSYCGDDYVIERMEKGEFDISFIPQGTMAERIRAAGCGLGGFYTPSGVGTIVEEGKEKRVIDGKEYIFEKPLHADVALVKAYKADQYGNAVCKFDSWNFNTVMAMAGKTVILEAEEIAELGELDPNFIHIPGILVDYVVKAEVSEV